tara:strand:+ start:822 stop:1037 length:216 start_codon:yes stop_codon:yes gene_type:complete
MFVFLGLMAGYTSEVAKSHSKFTNALKRAKTRQACLNAFWKHKKEHENLLRRHLKEELAEVNKKKAKIPYR